MEPTISVLWDDRSQPAPVICGTTAWNGLGFNPHQIWAFRRAELTAMSETPFRLENGSRASMVPIRTLPPRSFGLARMEPVVRALLLPHLEKLAAVTPNAQIPVVLCVAERLADTESGQAPAERMRLESQVSALVQAAGLRPALFSVTRGNASLASAMAEMGGLVAAGRYEAAIVGGIDTWYDPAAIEALQRNRRIFDGENLDSFIPGEGGAFFLLSRRNVARRGGWPVLARVNGASMATEPQPMEGEGPVAAAGLTSAVRVLCDQLEAEKRKLDWWLSDLTQESYRIHEFQLTFPRVSPSFPPQGDRVFEALPPLLGDLGAATMPTALAIATEAFVRGDPAASTCLITGSSVGPDRGAVLLSRIT
jgi:3-oxoacyl-[acyl-carrier-protein] synthase-1